MYLAALNVQFIMQQIDKTPLSVLLLYAIGQTGWSLAVYGVSNLLNYFYLPPEADHATVFPSYIYQGAILGIATLLGLISFGGRFIDAFIDPIVAGWSDRTVSRLGRRRKFMALSFIPLALFGWLAFMPLQEGESTLNALWLIFTLALFYFSLSMYVTPYTALISELGHKGNQTMLISTIVSVTWALGFGIGISIYYVQQLIGDAMAWPPHKAFQAGLGIFALLSALFMAIPVLFVNEPRYSTQIPSEKSSWEAVKAVFNDHNFKWFAVSDLMYWVSLTFIQMGMGYYITVLLELPSEQASLLQMVMLGVSFLFYVPVNIMARKWGKKRLMQISFLSFALVFIAVACMGKLAIPPLTYALGLGVLAALPIAIFSILPNAVVSDIIEQDALETGDHKAGQFYAVRTFMMKVGISLANLLFPSLLLLGKSSENSFGIRLTAIIAALFCILGWAFFRPYRDKF